MKYVAVVLNVLLLLIAAMVIVPEFSYAIDEWESPELPFLVLLFIVPVINLCCLLSVPKELSSWLGLYFKRKKLEEKAKIEKLNNQE